jgi:hypothetical protein
VNRAQSIAGTLPPRFTAHHIGCVVATIQNGVSTYAETLMMKRRSRTFDVPSQGVSVCFLQLHAGFYLEVVAQHANQTKLSRYVQAGFYHLCVLANDLRSARAHLKQNGFVALPAFASEAFAGHQCQFFVSPQTHLIEVAEMSPETFDEFFAANLADPDGV